MIDAALDELVEQVLDALDPTARIVADAMWHELGTLGRVRALLRLGAGVVPAGRVRLALIEGSAGEDAETQALRLAVARLLAAGPTGEAQGHALLNATLEELALRMRSGSGAEPHASLAVELELALDLVFMRAKDAGPSAMARVATEYSELCTLDYAACALAQEVGIVAALESEAGGLEIAPHARDAALALAGELARRGDPTAYTAFLERNLDRHPQLLDRLIERAREAEDWERLLELARRGLSLREERGRYNTLAALALERLDRALP